MEITSETTNPTNFCKEIVLHLVEASPQVGDAVASEENKISLNNSSSEATPQVGEVSSEATPQVGGGSSEESKISLNNVSSEVKASNVEVKVALESEIQVAHHPNDGPKDGWIFPKDEEIFLEIQRKPNKILTISREWLWPPRGEYSTFGRSLTGINWEDFTALCQSPLLWLKNTVSDFKAKTGHYHLQKYIEVKNGDTRYVLMTQVDMCIFDKLKEEDSHLTNFMQKIKPVKEFNDIMSELDECTTDTIFESHIQGEYPGDLCKQFCLAALYAIRTANAKYKAGELVLREGDFPEEEEEDEEEEALLFERKEPSLSKNREDEEDEEDEDEGDDEQDLEENEVEEDKDTRNQKEVEEDNGEEEDKD
jgi:hypothetical protein